jgi:RimJ/RimL family protein N-acetyltransferase
MCVIEAAPVIETRRLRLRAPEPCDLDAITQLAAEFDVAKMLVRMPHPYRYEDAEEFLDRAMAHDPTRERVFLIEHEDQGPVGMMGFHPNEDDRFAEFGYWIGKPFWGRGFATEAAQAALNWASRSWGRRALTASHFADNPASGAVLSKSGFLYTGEVRQRASLARGHEAPLRMMVWLA